MFERLKALATKFKTWYDEHIVKGFWKATSFIAAAGSLVISYGPDVINFMLDKSDLISLALPQMSPEHKVWALLAGNALAALARPIRQKCLEKGNK